MRNGNFLGEDKAVLDKARALGISASSVKRIGANSGNEMFTANLRIGSRVVGSVTSCNSGGEFKYEGDSVFDFLSIVETIREEFPYFHFFGREVERSEDTIVSLLVDEADWRKKCNGKTVVLLSRGEPAATHGNRVVLDDVAVYPLKYRPALRWKIVEAIERDNKGKYHTFEIVNERFWE